MRSVMRVLVVWLVAMALPVQAFAAGAMLHCGPMHERMGAVGAAPVAQHDTTHRHSVAAPAAGEPVHHAHGAPSPAELGAPMPGPGPGDPTAGAPGHAGAEPTAATPLGDHQCSVCAACCVALALPATTATLPARPVEALFAALTLPAPPSFVPSGLDRPPRA